MNDFNQYGITTNQSLTITTDGETKQGDINYLQKDTKLLIRKLFTSDGIIF